MKTLQFGGLVISEGQGNFWQVYGDIRAKENCNHFSIFKMLMTSSKCKENYQRHLKM